MEYVYEILDRTNEDMFFSCGIFSTLEKAEEFLRSHDGSGDDHGGGIGEYADDLCKYDVNRREIDKPAWSENGDTVAQYTRDWEWSGDEEYQVWKTNKVT